ncbi:MAG TPA: isochorismatase family protein [Gryllotalpicola sp.]
MTHPARVSALWQDLLSDDDRARVSGARFGRRVGIGERAAILVIDPQNYMVGPVGGEDIAYPSSCGEAGRQALAAASTLLEAGRRLGIPIFYTRWEVARDGADMGAYRRKRDLIDTEGWAIEGTFGAQIADAVAPLPGDLVFVKKKPSAFLGTPLTGYLIDRGIDTVIVTGGSTSNCVRATSVDAVSLNYRVVVAADCVMDRFDISHRTALFDLDRQYGDVMWSEEIIAALEATR